VRIIARLFFFALALSAVIGCSRGKGGAPPQQPQPSPPTTPTPNVKPADPEAKRTEVNRAVVSTRLDPFANPKKGVDPRKLADFTRVTLYDLALGTAATEWVVPGNHTVLDLSSDGRSILATHATTGRERGVLRLWVIGADGQLKRWASTAHKLTRDGVRADASATASNDIRWAGFVGERVVSIARSGQIRVFDTEGLKPLATIEATPCRPAVTPDGTKVAFLLGPLVALLDPATRKVVGTHWVGTPPPHPALRFSPDGSKLAIGGNGRAVILSLATGHFQHLTLPKLDVNDNGLFDKPFGWAGNSYLLADSLLFDPQLPQPVWEYSPAELVQFRGGRVWACVRPSGSPNVTLRAHALPGPEVEAAVAAAKKKTDAFALHPGSGVKIDVTGVPEDRREETRKALEERLRETGYVPDPKAAATLFASIDHPGTKPTVIYSALGSYTYTKTPARLRLVLKDKELWNEAWAVEAPFTLDVAKGTVLTEYLGKLAIGQPDYKAFALAPLPSHFPGPNAPTTPLGKTDLAKDPAGK
jgi:hypothetical protein